MRALFREISHHICPPSTRLASSQCLPHKVLRLADTSIDGFRSKAFTPCIPASFPEGAFGNMEAVRCWFSPVARHITKEWNPRRGIPTRDSQREMVLSPTLTQLDRKHDFAQPIPIELTHKKKGTFYTDQSTWSDFIKHHSDDNTQPNRTPPGETRKAWNDYNIYIAQCPISDLPEVLQAHLPTPEVVLKAGRGDVYLSSIWLGMPPTYTPLHRDPNPNLFVQLAGTKRLRLYPPDIGREVFESVQARIGGHANAMFRGEEMMDGKEREVLDDAVWGPECLGEPYECECSAGDGMFIPKGWWHSVKSVGRGMHGSLCWDDVLIGEGYAGLARTSTIVGVRQSY